MMEGHPGPIYTKQHHTLNLPNPGKRIKPGFSSNTPKAAIPQTHPTRAWLSHPGPVQKPKVTNRYYPKFKSKPKIKSKASKTYTDTYICIQPRTHNQNARTFDQNSKPKCRFPKIKTPRQNTNSKPRKETHKTFLSKHNKSKYEKRKIKTTRNTNTNP